MAIASVLQGLIETEDGKVFELDSCKGSAWLESVSSFRYEPTGANKPYTVRQETKKGGDYWYGYRKVAGKLHKKYIGKSSELSMAKLEEIAEALNTHQQSRVTQAANAVTQVTEANCQRVTEAVTDRHTAERVTALELQMQTLQESLEAIRSELSGKFQTGNSIELPKDSAVVTESKLLNPMSNLLTDETLTASGVEDVEFLKEQNEDLKRLLEKKSPLVSGDLWQEIDRLKERNRQLRLKMSSERRESIEKISELEHRVENMLRRNQEKQARLDELEIQIEGVTDSELQNDLGNLEYDHALITPEEALANAAIFGFSPEEALADAYFQINMLQANYDELEDRHTATKREIAELRSQLETERASREEITNLAPIAIGVEFSDAATILSQLRARRKKSKADLADLEAILEILEG